MFITFSGIDGSGKSTQIERLQQAFMAQGRQVVCLWSRGGYTPGFEFIKKTLRGLMGRQLPASGDVSGRERYFKSGFVRRVWIWIALMDLLRVYTVSIRLRRFFGTSVICDRYLPDTLIDLKILFPGENVERWILWKTLKCLSPKPDSAFLMTVPYGISQQRSAAKGDRHVEPEGDLKRRYRLYDDLTRCGWFHIMDGTKPAEEVFESILENLGEGVPEMGRPTTTQ